MQIEIAGVKYQVTETMAYHGPSGCQAKLLATPDGERVAINRGGKWVWWTARDRTAPLRKSLLQAKETPAS